MTDRVARLVARVAPPRPGVPDADAEACGRVRPPSWFDLTLMHDKSRLGPSHARSLWAAAILALDALGPGCGERTADAAARVAAEASSAERAQLIADCAVVDTQIGSGMLDESARRIAITRLPLYARVSNGGLTPSDLSLSQGKLPCDAAFPAFADIGWRAFVNSAARSASAWLSSPQPSAELVEAIAVGPGLSPESAIALTEAAGSAATTVARESTTSRAAGDGEALCELAKKLSIEPPACGLLRTRTAALALAERRSAEKAARDEAKAKAAVAAEQARAARRADAEFARGQAEQEREEAANRSRVQRLVPSVMRCIGSCNRGNPNDRGTEQWQEYSAGCTMDCCQEYGLSIDDVMSLN